MPEIREDTARRLEQGRAHFNAGRFFEAHEAWETAWLGEKGATRLCLQGLIQIAAGFLKASSGAPAGCVRLLSEGLEKAGPACAAGVAPEFLDGVRSALDRARRWQRGEGPAPAEFPQLPPLTGVK